MLIPLTETLKIFYWIQLVRKVFVIFFVDEIIQKQSQTPVCIDDNGSLFFFLYSWKHFFFGQISSSFAKCLWKLVWKTLNTSEFNNNLRWIFICLNVELSVHLHMNQCSLRLLCDMIIERKKKKRFTGADDATWLQV